MSFMGLHSAMMTSQIYRNKQGKVGGFDLFAFIVAKNLDFDEKSGNFPGSERKIHIHILPAEVRDEAGEEYDNASVGLAKLLQVRACRSSVAPRRRGLGASTCPQAPPGSGRHHHVDRAWQR